MKLISRKIYSNEPEFNQIYFSGIYDRVKAAQKANGNLSKEVEINELFHASSGWFERFRHRTGFDYSNNPHDDRYI